MWTTWEEKFLRSLNTPDKIQKYIDSLIYNPENAALSSRYVMLSGDGHCLEGAFVAAAAMEFLGYPPLVVDLLGHRDDDHVIYVYRTSSGWGSIGKSNTTLLKGRPPRYRSIQELVMSYFPFYFNTDGQLSLYAYSKPINLNRYGLWNWRWGEDNLENLGKSFSDETHFEIITKKALGKLPPVSDALMKACFLGADQRGLYKTS